MSSILPVGAQFDAEFNKLDELNIFEDPSFLEDVLEDPSIFEDEFDKAFFETHLSGIPSLEVGVARRPKPARRPNPWT